MSQSKESHIELSDIERRSDGTNNPVNTRSTASQIRAALFIAIWIFMSGSVIIFNKWILVNAKFPYPIFLTTWHLVFSTFMTQIMARTTTLMDARHTLQMTNATFVKAVVPIGVFFSFSLVLSNYAYIHLSVSFIQMLKATTPVFVLLFSCAWGLQKFEIMTLLNVAVITIGIAIASYGEIRFNRLGFILQAGGIIFESIRLVMVNALLSKKYKMDPLISLYYFAPVCLIFNMIAFCVFEFRHFRALDLYSLGWPMLIINAAFAFGLNVSVVYLIGKTSSLVLTLSGVLKDIILVTLSIILFNSVVTPLQLFGYAIALSALVYYKLK